MVDFGIGFSKKFKQKLMREVFCSMASIQQNYILFQGKQK
jgi:hypothetical protein